MAHLFIEDKYYESKLPDGSIVFTRTRYIVQAIQFYRRKCLEIINNTDKTLSNTPRVKFVPSFEEAMKEMEKLTDAKKRNIKAKELLEKLDKILQNMAQQNEPPQKQ